MIDKYYGTELYHHGIKGQKWGVRRYQYTDGSLTPMGKKRQSANSYKGIKKKAYVKKYPETKGLKVVEKGEPIFVRLDVEQETEFLKNEMSKK